MEFLVLGPLDVLDGDRSVPLGSAKQRMLLAALLVHANAAVPVDRLADILWGDEPPADAVATVQTYVSRLRAALEPDRAARDEATILLTRAPGYLLRVGTDELDTARFEGLLADGQRGAAAGDPDTAVRRFDAALALWRGNAYAEFADEDFARTESLRLEELRRVAIDERVEAKLSLGRHAELIGELEGITAADPLRERPRGQLMLALFRSGREAEALRAYHAYHQHLGAELGVEPSDELQSLERDIIDRSAHLAWTPPDAPAGDATTSGASTRLAPEGPGSLPVGTVTFVFTDLEGSTRLWEEHPEDMKAALSRHDEILRGAMQAHHGHVFKTMGDGVCAVFSDAPDAARAATAVLQALGSEEWGATGPLRARIAIHTGTPEQRDGDYFGPVLNRTSRLMAAAHGGQFVLSEVSARLVRATLPDDVRLIDLGEHRLSGLVQPERVYQLAIEGLPSQFPPLRSLDAFPGALALPEPTFPRDEGAFAGRDVERERLHGLWQGAAGNLQVGLVAGEPGIGKTRLAAELSRLVHTEGGIVFYGRCDEEAIVPYQPFVEALREYIEACASSVLHERLHGLEYDLGRVFPELLGRIPDVAAPATSEPDTERYRLFEAITRLLQGITATQPALLVLDDLHWADKPTLMLLRHLVRSAPGGLLIVATYRDIEIDRDHPAADLFADLHRERFVVTASLTGLSVAESQEFLSNVAGREVSAGLAEALHRETNGNPFFLEELLRHLLETNPEFLEVPDDTEVDLGGLDLPDTVREVIERRVRRLPDPVNDVLQVAAVVGAEFDAAVLEGASEHGIEAILDSLDRAKGARLVQDYGRSGRYAFSHAFVRETLYIGLGTARRAQLHAKVATTIEGSSGGEQHAATLAHHYTQAMPLVGPAKAIEYATRAGHDAINDLAFEDAVTYFERALDLLDEPGQGDVAKRVDLRTDLASALVYVHERAGVRAALEAVDDARAHGSSAQFGRAVAVFVEPTYAAEGFAARVAPLVDEACDSLGGDHPALQARLLAFEAFKHAAYQLPGLDGPSIAEESVRLARDADDPETLADALFALAANLEGTERVTERVELGEELVALGPSVGGRASAFGLRVLASAHLELGDADALDSAISDLAGIGDELRWRPARVYAAQLRGTQALLEGRFDDVRARGQELRRYARAYRGAAGAHTHQGFYLAREQGELGRTSPGEIPEEHLRNLYSQASLALAQLESDDTSGALRSLERAADSAFLRDHPESAWAGALAMFAEVAAMTHAPAPHAEALYELLDPFAGLLLTAVLGIACLGAADRYLGMLGASLGRWDAASAHFDAALALEERIRGHALVPRTRYWQARALLARGRADDERAARDALTRVVDDATALGMGRLRAQAAELMPR